jgi:hypothetical protein
VLAGARRGAGSTDTATAVGRRGRRSPPRHRRPDPRSARSRRVRRLHPRPARAARHRARSCRPRPRAATPAGRSRSLIAGARLPAAPSPRR